MPSTSSVRACNYTLTYNFTYVYFLAHLILLDLCRSFFSCSPNFDSFSFSNMKIHFDQHFVRFESLHLPNQLASSLLFPSWRSTSFLHLNLLIFTNRRRSTHSIAPSVWTDPSSFFSSTCLFQLNIFSLQPSAMMMQSHVLLNFILLKSRILAHSNQPPD